MHTHLHVQACVASLLVWRHLCQLHLMVPVIAEGDVANLRTGHTQRYTYAQTSLVSAVLPRPCVSTHNRDTAGGVPLPYVACLVLCCLPSMRVHTRWRPSNPPSLRTALSHYSAHSRCSKVQQLVLHPLAPHTHPPACAVLPGGCGPCTVPGHCVTPWQSPLTRKTCPAPDNQKQQRQQRKQR
jgi:hypothetical protein